MNPDAHPPSATAGELSQSRLILGLLRRGEHLPELACVGHGRARGGVEKWGRKSGQDEAGGTVRDQNGARWENSGYVVQGKGR